MPKAPALPSMRRIWKSKSRLTPAARRRISAEVLTQALAAGASLAGIAYGATLRTSPSHRRGEVRWPVDARSAIVLAKAHPTDAPDLDLWDGKRGRTPGNRALIRVSSLLVRWLSQRHGIIARAMPYQSAQGGIYAKDAAVMAGLGTIGRNNLVVTPAFGPRIRLRVILTTARLVPTGPSTAFDPCDGCAAPCRAACPQGVFDGGAYARARCMRQMVGDEAAPEAGQSGVIQYCRACELACPIGS